MLRWSIGRLNWHYIVPGKPVPPLGGFGKKARISYGIPLAGIEWERFPLAAMAKLGWIPKVRNLKSRAKELIGELIQKAGGPDVAAAALYRINDHARANAKMDPYALKACSAQACRRHASGWADGEI